MESNERDQMIDDNQRGQNTQPQWQSNGNGISATYPRTDDDGVETAEDDVRREWSPDTEVPEPIQRTQPLSDENDDDTDDEKRTDRDQRQNFQTAGMDYAEDDVRREMDTDNFGQARQPLSEVNDEDYDRANRDQQQNLQTPQSSHTEDEQENAADEIRTDFAGDGFRRELNIDNNGQDSQYNPEYDQPINNLSDENSNEANEEIPRSTDNPNEMPDRDQNHGFRVPVSDNEETV